MKRAWLAAFLLACAAAGPGKPLAPRLVITSALDERGRPVDRIERISRRSERFSVWLRWFDVPLGVHHHRFEAIKPDGDVDPAEADVEHETLSTDKRFAYLFEPGDPPGLWLLRVYLDGELGAEASSSCSVVAQCRCRRR